MNSVASHATGHRSTAAPRANPTRLPLASADLCASLAMAALFAVLALTVRNDGVSYMLSLIMVWAIFALGYDLAFGTAGILSFGHAAYFGLGAYGATWAMLRFNLPFSVGMVCALLMGALAGTVVAWIGRRVTGLYFSLLTLMLAELVSIVMLTRLRDLSGGVDGIPGVPRPSFGGIDFFANGAFVWVVFGLFLATVLGVHVLRRSPLGQALQGLRQNAVRLEQLGLNVGRLRLVAMALSGAVSGLAGALLASLMMYISPQLLHWKMSGDVLIMTLLGGSGTLLGPILGVAFFEVVKEGLAAYTDHWYGLLGVIFIAGTIFMPKGLAGLVLRRWRRA
ncbi:branched-chain amino acid ABC transporter permease [Pseudorhodoferax soli]|uniref:Amino acid/amide ABC transporter membrane protein 2 (HAAT family) n=1 Tax=Pseudorhodoferax soli TaxID=545864 RepID=A0A368XNG7_9BURK|nr:branched-chain amino acid ABC transporter permease [Pseudorhodoferax soli]RCW69405.1 amino acid/amide ABC transporter membrane protein 2 (HAAT family) [Pseudorhodoferax soli]